MHLLFFFFARKNSKSSVPHALVNPARVWYLYFIL